MLLEDRLHHIDLGVRRRAEFVLLLRLGDRVFEALVVGECHPHLDALGGGDPALRLDVLPRRVVALGPDQTEDVAFPAVLTDQRGGETEAAPRLQISRHPEHRRGQQVDLVIDDQPPVAGVEQIKIPVLALGFAGHHLIGRDGDRADLLALARVLADLFFGQRRTCDELALPLPAGDRVGDEDERGGLCRGHRGRTDHGLACTTGQHHHTGSARPERLGGQLLVVTQLPAVLVQLDLVGFAVDVPGEVLGRPAHLQQDLLETAALGGMNDDRVVVHPGAQHRRHLLVTHDLDQHRAVEADQGQSVHRTLHQL